MLNLTSWRNLWKVCLNRCAFSSHLSSANRNENHKRSKQRTFSVDETFVHLSGRDGYQQSHPLFFTAHFNYLDTDSSIVFISNAGEKPQQFLQSIPDENGIYSAQFSYLKILKPKEEIKIIQLIGSCAKNDEDKIASKFLPNFACFVKNKYNMMYISSL